MTDHLCLDCVYANWKRTYLSRLHPSGDGRCAWNWVPQPIPVAFYWLDHAAPYGGSIKRRPLKPITDCPLFTQGTYAPKPEKGK